MKGFLGSGSSNSGSKGTTTVDTLIGRQTEILGDVRFSGGLHVDGKIKGNVSAIGDKAASLSISESGVVEGDVRVPTMMLNGSVVGDVRTTEKLVLNAKARVNGNVYYKLLQMEPGAMINGQLLFEPNEPAAITHQKSPDGKTESAVLDLNDARRSKSG
jgi:cytoskeletal protein CcmA (bactofilin family)